TWPARGEGRTRRTAARSFARARTPTAADGPGASRQQDAAGGGVRAVERVAVVAIAGGLGRAHDALAAHVGDLGVDGRGDGARGVAGVGAARGVVEVAAGVGLGGRGAPAGVGHDHLRAVGAVDAVAAVVLVRGRVQRAGDGEARGLAPAVVAADAGEAGVHHR